MSKFLMVIALATAAVPAAAMNMNFFKDAPITRLKADEVKAYRAAVMKALDETADGATVEWKAPTTEFTSKITPHNRFTDGKFQCRDVTIESDAHDRSLRGRYTFCKGAKGDWGFRNSKAPRS